MARKIMVVAKKTLGIMDGSLKRLVFAEVRDCQSQRIDRNPRIRDAVPNHEDEARDVFLAAGFCMICARVVDLFEVDGRFVRRLPQVLDGDVLDLDLDFVALTGEKGFNRFGLLVGFYGRVRETAVEEVK